MQRLLTPFRWLAVPEPVGRWYIVFLSLLACNTIYGSITDKVEDYRAKRDLKACLVVGAISCNINGTLATISYNPPLTVVRMTLGDTTVSYRMH